MFIIEKSAGAPQMATLWHIRYIWFSATKVRRTGPGCLIPEEGGRFVICKKPKISFSATARPKKTPFEVYWEEKLMFREMFDTKTVVQRGISCRIVVYDHPTEPVLAIAWSEEERRSFCDPVVLAFFNIKPINLNHCLAMSCFPNFATPLQGNESRSNSLPRDSLIISFPYSILIKKGKDTRQCTFYCGRDDRTGKLVKTTALTVGVVSPEGVYWTFSSYGDLIFRVDITKASKEETVLPLDCPAGMKLSQLLCAEGDRVWAVAKVGEEYRLVAITAEPKRVVSVEVFARADDMNVLWGESLGDRQFVEYNIDDSAKTYRVVSCEGALREVLSEVCLALTGATLPRELAGAILELSRVFIWRA